MWKLKKNQPHFEAVDGEFSGQQFEHGKEYKEIPPAEKHKFEIAKQVAAKAKKEVNNND